MSLVFFEKCLWATIAALGFGMLFTVPRRAFWAVGLLAAIGYGLRGATLLLGGDLVAGSLVASCTMGLLSIQLAHWVHTPTTVFMAPAVIPMVPGVFAYRTMMGLLEMSQNPKFEPELLIQTVSYGLSTVFILLALAVGVTIPSLLFRNRSVKEIRFLGSKKVRV